MALNPDVVGEVTPPLVHEYTWRDTALYALGVGAKEGELDFLYEGRGPKVLPTYAVVPAYDATRELFGRIGGDLRGVVHGAQSVTQHRALEGRGVLRTTGEVTGIYDLKRMATATVQTRSVDAEDRLVCETEWQLIYRLDGGFGGAPPPKTERVRIPEREPDLRVEETTAREQALLYRLNGDDNPLHADPDVGAEAGFDRPILHGLCTFGYVGRAVVHSLCGGDPARLGALRGQFRKPVWPGDTLRIEGWREGDRILLRASTAERPADYAFTNALAVLK